MSNFDTAVMTVLRHEGVFSNNKNDPGGPTKYGISLRFLASLPSETADLNKDGLVNYDDVANMSIDNAKDLYRHEFWDRYQYHQIKDQSIATKVFDASVHIGAKYAHICLQRACRAAAPDSPLVEDGVLGSRSIKTINLANPAILLAALKSELAGYYRSLNKAEFINGWLNRAYDD